MDQTMIKALAEYLKYSLNAGFVQQETGYGEEEMEMWAGRVDGGLRDAAKAAGFKFEWKMPDGYCIITPPETTDKVNNQ